MAYNKFDSQKMSFISSFLPSLNHSFIHSFTQSVSQSLSESACEWVSQSVSQSVHHATTQSVWVIHSSHSVTQLVSQLVIHALCQPDTVMDGTKHAFTYLLMCSAAYPSFFSTMSFSVWTWPKWCGSQVSQMETKTAERGEETLQRKNPKKLWCGTSYVVKTEPNYVHDFMYVYIHLYTCMLLMSVDTWSSISGLVWWRFAHCKTY